MATQRDQQVAATVRLGQEAADCAQVSIRATTTFKDLPALVSAISTLGVSATVTLRGPAQDVQSAIARLNSTTTIVSAELTLQGDKPAGG